MRLILFIGKITAIEILTYHHQQEFAKSTVHLGLSITILLQYFSCRIEALMKVLFEVLNILNVCTCTHIHTYMTDTQL